MEPAKRMFDPAVQEFLRRANLEYWHWDQVRRHPLPAGWDASALWCLIKAARVANRREFGLQSSTGEPFRFWLPEGAQHDLYQTDIRMGARLRFDELDVTASELRRYTATSLMEEAIASSQIEGAQTTREVAREMLRRGRRPRTRAEQMILNNYKTILMIRDLKGRALSGDMLLDLQRSMTHGTLDDPSAAGRFRRSTERVRIVDERDNTVLHDPPPASELPARMDALCRFANEEDGGEPFIHPIVRAILLHFWLGYEHPFVDGNGRTARALFYWYALRRGYWFFEYLPISRIIARAPIRYGRAYLYAESDDKDATYFIVFHLQVIRTAFTELVDYLRAQRSRLDEAKDLQKRYRELNLNHRQIQLIQDAINDEVDEHTIQKHRGVYGVSYGSAYTDLDGLVRRGLFERARRGRQLVFYPADDLAERLRGT